MFPPVNSGSADPLSAQEPRELLPKGMSIIPHYYQFRAALWGTATFRPTRVVTFPFSPLTSLSFLAQSISHVWDA